MDNNEHELVKPLADKAQVVISLADKVNLLMDIKDSLAELDKQVQVFKELKANVSSEILNELKKRQEFSVRLQHGTVTLSVKKTASVVDQKAVVEYLKTEKLTDYVDEQVNDLFKDKVLKEIAKSGELIPGVVIRESEYITVRESNKDERRRVVTEDYKKLDK